jgi:DHA1 family inner membrane transport protein
VLGYVVHSLFPAVDTYMLASLPDRHRASAYALYSSIMMFVQALGSGSVGIAVSRGVSYTVVFRMLSGALAVVLGCLFVLYRAGWLPAGGAAHRAAGEGGPTGQPER